MRLELRTPRAEDTRAVGSAVASLLRTGDAVALSGDLGAGKTTFVQGAAKELGFDGHVVSPTFTLVREYRGRLPIFHVDVYRLERVQDVLDLDLEEMLSEGVMLVEWGDAVEGLLPEEHLSVELTTPWADETRLLVLEGAGPSWEVRWRRLEAATQTWRVAA
ncbi:MAG TPA: tRNA (adenosine(37)-N6)-threonylcarbamoyltransferase complex ATPase subunit type 1 TsaE [Actinomycetota bacterium]|jgi:tRNA threonylcarbamoyladenosine biosynthesis protein TsaE|nr:tRNA (adenosine(37)-N6)-threonylcarbamoyltransferase complex ATPase subunit type 1 TsaE [Actinomycetota bacterium]